MGRPDRGGSKSGPAWSPVLLDLTGNGLTIDPLSSSSKFIEMGGDGYERRTAWAAEGTGVLVLDMGGDGKITESKEFVFTEWAPGATGDLAALKSGFDTNQNGKLDAGDARWAEFKVMVGDTLVSLSDLGIESIDLTPTGTGRVFSDGSAITGTTTFTRTDGTKGEVGDAILASDSTGYLVTRSVVANADGSTTTEISAFNKAGALAFRERVTLSADKANTTTDFDEDGNGSYDRRQTCALTIGADGSRTTVVSNFAKDGSLASSTTTIRSGDKSTVTTLLDRDGDGVADERQVFVTNSDKSTSTTVEALSANGAILTRFFTNAAADGLSKTTTIDSTGRGIVDLVRSETVVVNADGSRTTTFTDASANGTLLSKRVETASANGNLKTIELDSDGNGRLDGRQVITTEVSDTAYQTNIQVFNEDGTLRSQSKANTARDGQTETVEYDRNGDGVFEERTSQLISVNNGVRTESIVRSAPVDQYKSTTTIAPDASTRSLLEDSNGDGYADRNVEISKTAQNTTTSTKILNRAGAVIGSELTIASSDGANVSTSIDRDGDGIFDEFIEKSTTAQANGARRTEVKKRSGSAGQLSGSTIQTVSADGLTIEVFTDSDGNGGYERSSRDVTIVNADGSRTQRISVHANQGQKLSGSEATISADRKTSTLSEDLDGDGQSERLQTVINHADGSQSSTAVSFAGAAVVSSTSTTKSADGLTMTAELDADGNGVVDLKTVDQTELNADGSRTQTLSARAGDGTLLSKSILKISGNGLTKESTQDRNGDGTVDLRTTDATVINQNGSITRTVSSAVDGVITTTVSANGLSKTTVIDADGNGVAERIVSELTEFGTDLSVVNTVSTTDAAGKLIRKAQKTTSADRSKVEVTDDTTGNSKPEVVTASQVEANGATTNTTSTYVTVGPKWKLTSRLTTTVSANGLSRTQTLDFDGNGTTDKWSEHVKTLQSDGSVDERFTEFDGSGARLSDTSTRVLRGGLEKLTEWRADGVNLSRRAAESRVYSDDGGVVDTVTFHKGDGSLESRTTTSVSGNKRSTTISRDIDGDGTVDQVAKSLIQADGALVTTFDDLAADGAGIGARRTVTASANGLVKTTDFDANGDGQFEQRYWSAIMLNSNGSKTETTTEYGSDAVAKARTVVERSGDGLTIQERWDLNADGTFERSRTRTTQLNADSSTTDTISDYEGASLSARYTSTASANGLVTSKQWDLNGDGVIDQSTSDTTSLNSDGTTTRVIQHFEAGTLQSSSTITKSANGQVVTVQEKRSHVSSDVDRTLQSSTRLLADGTTVESRSIRNAGNESIEAQTITTHGDGRTVEIERDANSDSRIDQVEIRSNLVDGSRKTVVTNLKANGSKSDTTIISVAADGRSTFTEWDQDGDGVVDRRRMLTESFNADGSYENLSVDTKTAGNTLASRTVLKASADGRTRTVARDVDGDGTVDVNEVSVTDISGVTVVTTTNASAARTASNLREGDVYWAQAIAAKTELTIAGNGLTRTMRSDYDGDGVFEHIGVSQTQIDGSVVTRLTEHGTNGNVVAKGVSTVSADGLTTILKKDANADGRDNRVETSVRRVDGSVVHTIVENNSDGTLKQTTRNDVDALGRPTYRIVSDALGRKISDHTFRPDGYSSQTGYDAASGHTMWSVNFRPDGTRLNAFLFDPLNREIWVNITQIFDETGSKSNEAQINDDGTNEQREFNTLTGKITVARTITAGQVTAITYFNADGLKTRAVHYDPLNQAPWFYAEQTFDASGVKTLEKQFMDGGGRSEFHYRSPGGQVYEIHNFNNDGALLSQSFHDTAGKKVSAVFFDPLNQNVWSRVEQTFDAAGVNILEKQFLDNGGRTESYYRSPGGQLVEVQNFAGDGALLTKTFYDTAGRRTNATIFDPYNQDVWSRVEQTFDTANVKTLEVQFRDDGTRFDLHFHVSGGQHYETRVFSAAGVLTYRTEYDAFGNQAWSRREHVIDAQGRTTQTSVFNDDGTKKVDHFDAANAHAWSTSASYFNAAGQLYYVDQANDNGTYNTVSYDVANNQGWSRYEQYKDSSGRVLVQTNFNDNGTRTTYSYDPTNAQTWSLYQQNYNAAGQLASVDQTNDNGSHNNIHYDVDNNQGWSRYDQYIDGSGRLLNQVNYYDNGTREAATFDPTNVQTWSSYKQHYNAAGQLHFVDQANDNGTRNTINYDVANNQGWLRYEQAFESSGRLVNQVNYNDDGTNHVYQFDPANTQIWMKITQVYNPAGALEWQANEFDNGTTETTTFNVYNNQPWSKFVEVKNAAGTVTTTAAYQSDNSRFAKFWDVSNSQPWSSLEQYINAAGQVTAQFQKRDDGSVEETRYNGQGTARQIATFDANYYLAMNPDIAAGWHAPAIEHYNQFGWKEGRRPNAYFDGNFYLQQNVDIKNGGLNPFEHWRGSGYAEGRSPHAGYQRFDARAQSDLAALNEPLFANLQLDRIATMRSYARSTYNAIQADNESPYRGATAANLRMIGYVHDDRTVLSKYPQYVANRFGTGLRKPVALDLNGDDHIDLRMFSPAEFEAGNGPRFDWDGDGIADGTGWVGPDDGWLTIDVAAEGGAGPDGLINQAKELAFTMWKTPDELAEEQADITDLEALRLVFDTNHNNLLDTGDARWSEFRVWRDANQNGNADAGELRTLAEADISLIDLVPSSEGAREFSDGSAITGTSSYLKGDGSRALVGDAKVASRPSRFEVGIA
ncbi:hypothetical protein [Ensifer sp. Root31]|uniref:hypothetical protein n=1 Tax=Ensifer sp. Root31 TaxID=1736512 RepID=UPI0012E8021F|nr:hypothetical protein [Ensifer sp. Root31]